MRTSSLESKTIRPGSLGAYSYYHSSRTTAPTRPAYIATSRRKLIPNKVVATVLVVVAILILPLLGGDSPAKKSTTQQPTTKKSAPAASAIIAAPVQKATDHCKDNKLDKLVLISISQRHMWACEHDKTVHDAPVITGMAAHEETLTPPGTYKVYAKQTNTSLVGTDSTGSWNRPVSYWMPFLDNQHGTYGFHDATWRAADAFGTVSPDSSDASHGCVELPLADSAWLYNWAHVGTTLTIES